jgi:hypothetical protein
MVLSWTFGWGPFISASSDDMVDGRSWRKIAIPVDTKALKDFFLIFLFTEGLCVA